MKRLPQAHALCLENGAGAVASLGQAVRRRRARWPAALGALSTDSSILSPAQPATKRVPIGLYAETHVARVSW
ncbi:MAG: hypothetical protein AAF460_17385, partial [Pseudomonadota bacterium]